MNNLISLGWNNFFENEMKAYSDSELTPGRIIRVNKNNYIAATETGEITAELSGKFLFSAESKSEFPAVGDWTAMRLIPDESKGIIESVIKRKNKFSRKVTLNVTDEQVIAANIDFLFIVSSLNQEINHRRLERYLTLCYESNVTPVIVLTKSDLSDNTEGVLEDIKFIAGDTDVKAVSALYHTGISDLLKYFSGNKTVALAGSSGVGKSTLINCLSGMELLKVKEISDYKDKGRHTTSHRELILLSGGGMIIDTPGMRELQMWEGGDGLSETFSDIELLIGNCKFSDCRHETEPGCAVLEAMESGELDEKRYRSYLKLKKEIKYFERRKNVLDRLSEKRKWKKITKTVRKNNKRIF